MHIFRGVNFLPPRRDRHEAQLAKDPAPEVEVDPGNNEIAARFDEPSQVPQARFCAVGRHMEKKIVREDHVVKTKARGDIW